MEFENINLAKAINEIRFSEQEFDILFKRLYRPLCYFADTLLNDFFTAEDIVLSAFTKLWDKKETIERAEALKSYLYTTVRNNCLNRIRNEKRERKKLNSIPFHHAWDEPILHDIIKAETLHEIYRAYETLPTQCAKVFQMFFLEGKDYKTIAKEMGLSIDTIRNQKRRALMLIRSRMLLIIIPFILVLGRYLIDSESSGPGLIFRGTVKQSLQDELKEKFR